MGIEVAIRRQRRLRHRKDFDAIRRGRSWNNEFLVLRTLSNDLPHSRLGFIVSKRVGNAVVRNRVRRRLKEIIRTLPLPEGRDIVFSAKTSAPGATFQQLKSAVIGLLTRSQLLDRGGEGSLS